LLPPTSNSGSTSSSIRHPHHALNSTTTSSPAAVPLRQFPAHTPPVNGAFTCKLTTPCFSLPATIRARARSNFKSPATVSLLRLLSSAAPPSSSPATAPFDEVKI
jgi:hypothetical protein